MTTLGLVTIGQAPRKDMVPEMARHWPGVAVLERGALDGWDAAAIEASPHRGGDEVLTSRLSDGTSVVFGRDLVVPLLQERISELEEAGVEATLLVCTGTFPEFEHSRPLLTASPLFVNGVRALARGTVGVLCPLPEQEEDSTAKFSPTPTVTTSVDPYTAGEAAFREVARGLVKQGATMLVLDCMGYTEQHREWIGSAANVPVLLARSIVARLAGEVLAA